MIPGAGGAFFSPFMHLPSQQGYLQQPVVPTQAPGQLPVPDGKRQKITTAAIPLSKMPNKHKVESIEALVPQLDPTLTGNLPADELTIILFLLTRVKSDMKLTDLRADFYDDVTKAMEKASVRLKDKNPPEYRALTDAIIALLSDPKETSDTKSDLLLELGLQHGFQISWLRKKSKEKAAAKPKSIADRMEEMARKRFKPNGVEAGTASLVEPGTAAASGSGASGSAAAPNPAVPAAPAVLPAAPPLGLAAAAPSAGATVADSTSASTQLQNRPVVPTPFIVAARLAANRQQQQLAAVASEAIEVVPVPVPVPQEVEVVVVPDPEMEAAQEIPTAEEAASAEVPDSDAAVAAPVAPEAPALTEAETLPEGVVAEAPPLCVICQGPLVNTEEVETLPCYHVLHRSCVVRYSQVCGREIKNCCPFKCNPNASSAAQDELLSLATTSAPASMPVADDDELGGQIF